MVKRAGAAPCHLCGSDNIRFFCTKNSYTLFRCRDCGLLFVFPTPVHIEDLYGEQYFKNTTGSGYGYVNYDKDKEPMREVFELYLKKLEELQPGRSIFDVGAATGYFLDIAKKRGWKTSGSEVSDYARIEANTRGHAVIREFAEHNKGVGVDAVTMWDVLEHVSDPRETMKGVNGILREGGILAINTVDASSVWAKALGKRWHLIVPPEHLWYFSPRNIRMLLSDAGFEIVEIKKIGKKFSLPYILKTLSTWQGMRLWERLASLLDTPSWRKLAVPINLRDNFFVIAKKVRNV